VLDQLLHRGTQDDIALNIRQNGLRVLFRSTFAVDLKFLSSKFVVLQGKKKKEGLFRATKEKNLLG
jgi:hypothetical protein